ncbi:hypothetical protein U9M48_008780 [Paspalum notatum var. saurae]|uniref:Uncharacterized protein n=1 Tax=Paspalum notatum var. saurae TaxID=547442 RepID=A0AAQ3SQU6_PASNO
MPHRWNRSVRIFFRPSAVFFCASTHARGEVPHTLSLRPSTSPTEPRKKKVLPKLISQDSTLEPIGDHVKKELVARSLSPSISITWGCSKYFLHPR